MFLSQNSSHFSKFTFDLPAYGRSFLFSGTNKERFTGIMKFSQFSP